MNIVIASLKYSPVHYRHCRAFGEPLRAAGYSVSYLLPPSMQWLIPQSQRDSATFVGSSRNAHEVLWDTLACATWRRSWLSGVLREKKPSLLLFESSHPANAIVAGLARSAAPGVKVWMLVHEPFVAEKAKHGAIRRFLIAAQEWGVKRLLPHLDGVLVPSDEAKRQMAQAFPDFAGAVLKVPLLFEDRGMAVDCQRRYFSFIGHAVPAKGIDTFFSMVQASADLGRDWQFQIATSSDVSTFVAGLSAAARQRLHVVHKTNLPDEDIDQAIRESWAVLAPYRRVTQSGVVPVAFMHGTPVISTATGGMPEHVIAGKTGYLVAADSPFSEWENAFHLVKANFPALSHHCRRFFLGTFDARRAPELLRPVLDSLGRKS